MKTSISNFFHSSPSPLPLFPFQNAVHSPTQFLFLPFLSHPNTQHPTPHTSHLSNTKPTNSNQNSPTFSPSLPLPHLHGRRGLHVDDLHALYRAFPVAAVFGHIARHDFSDPFRAGRLVLDCGLAVVLWRGRQGGRRRRRRSSCGGGGRGRGEVSLVGGKVKGHNVGATNHVTDTSREQRRSS